MDISELIRSGASPATPAAEPSADLGREEFLSMLIAQLENQDPLNPQDSTEFTAQLAQFSSLEQLIGMRSSIDALATSQSTSQNLAAATLIGREALVTTDDFTIGTDPEQARPRLFVEASAPTEVQGLEIRDTLGRVVARGDARALSAGRTELAWSDFDGTLPPGDYRLEVLTQPGTLPPFTMVRSRITGASLDGASPLLVMGGVEASMTSLVEVHE